MLVAGLVTVASRHSVPDTVDRLEEAVAATGATLFARIDHGAGAEQAGLELRPTVVLIFGAPKAGTPLMQAEQTVGIDLPLKALIWQDEAGKVWISYNDPAWIAGRHQVSAEKAAPIQGMSKMLAAISATAGA